MVTDMLRCANCGNPNLSAIFNEEGVAVAYLCTSCKHEDIFPFKPVLHRIIKETESALEAIADMVKTMLRALRSLKEHKEFE
jgi:hypothetical protein